MLKITDQYFWHVVFLVFFVILVVMGAIILDSESRMPLLELGFFDIAIITLASWRLVQFVANDNITKFFREQFYDLKKVGRGFSLQKPKTGPQRTIIDLITSPWNLGLWMTATVTFFYLLTPYALYPLLFIALSAVVGLLQLVTEMVERKIGDE